MLIYQHFYSRILQNDRKAPETKSSTCSSCNINSYSWTFRQRRIIFCDLSHLVVKPNWMAHVKTVFLKCGGLHNNFVCCHISDMSIFTSFGFRMLSARTDLLVRLEIVLILSRSLRLFICIAKLWLKEENLQKKIGITMDRTGFWFSFIFLLPDIQFVRCQYFLDTCILRFQELLQFHRIRWETLDFPERKIANNPVTSCVFGNECNQSNETKVFIANE